MATQRRHRFDLVHSVAVLALNRYRKIPTSCFLLSPRCRLQRRSSIAFYPNGERRRSASIELDISGRELARLGIKLDDPARRIKFCCGQTGRCGDQTAREIKNAFVAVDVSGTRSNSRRTCKQLIVCILWLANNPLIDLGLSMNIILDEILVQFWVFTYSFRLFREFYYRYITGQMLILLFKELFTLWKT